MLAADGLALVGDDLARVRELDRDADGRVNLVGQGALELLRFLHDGINLLGRIGLELLADGLALALKIAELLIAVLLERRDLLIDLVEAALLLPPRIFVKTLERLLPRILID